MKYIILELQTNANGTIGTLVNTTDDALQAQSIYHTILAAAAVSSLPQHAAVLLTNVGGVINHQCYTHEIVDTGSDEIP